MAGQIGKGNFTCEKHQGAFFPSSGLGPISSWPCGLQFLAKASPDRTGPGKSALGALHQPLGRRLDRPHIGTVANGAKQNGGPDRQWSIQTAETGPEYQQAKEAAAEAV